METPGRRVCAEDGLEEEAMPVAASIAEVQGTDPGGAAHASREGAAGGDADVFGETGADRGSAVHPGVGVNGIGVAGAASAAEPERQAVIRTVSGESSESGPDRAVAAGELQQAVHRDYQAS